MRVLVCGGRNYKQWRHVGEVLDGLRLEHGPFSIIQGGAMGADACASDWAYRRKIEDETYQADWNTHGRAAGPIRNQKMIDEGKPDLVVAFPGGVGTADMVRRAKAANIRVLEIK